MVAQAGAGAVAAEMERRDETERCLGGRITGLMTRCGVS